MGTLFSFISRHFNIVFRYSNRFHVIFTVGLNFDAQSLKICKIHKKLWMKQLSNSTPTCKPNSTSVGWGRSWLWSGYAKSGQIKSTQVKSGNEMTWQGKSCQAKSGQVESGHVKSGQINSVLVKSGQVKLGQVKSGQVKMHLRMEFDSGVGPTCFLFFLWLQHYDHSNYNNVSVLIWWWDRNSCRSD